MAFKIIWAAPAIDDLRDLTEFIAADNPSAAERVGKSIFSKTRFLFENPMFGRIVPEINRKDIRELIHNPYRIVYRVNLKSKDIEIIRIWHSARGTPELPGPRD